MTTQNLEDKLKHENPGNKWDFSEHSNNSYQEIIKTIREHRFYISQEKKMNVQELNSSDDRYMKGTSYEVKLGIFPSSEKNKRLRQLNKALTQDLNVAGGIYNKVYLQYGLNAGIATLKNENDEVLERRTIIDTVKIYCD